MTQHATLSSVFYWIYQEKSAAEGGGIVSWGWKYTPSWDIMGWLPLKPTITVLIMLFSLRSLISKCSQWPSSNFFRPKDNNIFPWLPALGCSSGFYACSQYLYTSLSLVCYTFWECHLLLSATRPDRGIKQIFTPMVLSTIKWPFWLCSDSPGFPFSGVKTIVWAQMTRG